MRKHRAVGLPQKTCGQGDVERGGDARTALTGVRRQRQFQPLANAVALDQQGFVFQRRERVAAHPLDGQPAQIFQAIGMHDHKAGR